MKKILFFSLILLIISFLGSCKKDEPIPPTIINGQVLEQGSNKPLEGVKVVLMEGTYSGLGTGTGTFNYYPIDTVLTDKNGNYSYNNPSSLSSQGSKDYVLWFWLSGIYHVSLRNTATGEQSVQKVVVMKMD